MLRKTGIYLSVFIFSLLFADEKVLIKKGVYKIETEKKGFFQFSTQKKIVLKNSFYIDKYEYSYKRALKNGCKVDIPYTVSYLHNYDLPIYNISYKQALECCKKAGGDLPSVIQWSAAGASVFKDFDFKNSEDDIVDVKKAVKTGKLYGIFGNVWEMTKSNSEKVCLKGGSYYDKKSAYFNPFVENYVLKKYISTYKTVGFRCVYKVAK